MDNDDDIDELDKLKQLEIVREMPVPIAEKRKLRSVRYNIHMAVVFHSVFLKRIYFINYMLIRHKMLILNMCYYESLPFVESLWTGNSAQMSVIVTIVNIKWW